ncbi:MAG: tetratricopeptide repeat protein [Bacteroidetes bacterium]|nr:tetratricopeptide repeat protein [Bacteroidota bacterium]
MKVLHLLSALLFAMTCHAQHSANALLVKEYIEGKNIDEGKSFFEALLADDPMNAEVNACLGGLYNAEGNTLMADSLINYSLVLDSNCLECIRRKSLMLSQAGSHREALRGYQNYLAQRKAIGSDYANLALIFNYLGDSKQADENIKAALEIDPNDVRAIIISGYFQLKKGYAASAVSTLRRAEKLDSGNVRTILFLSDAYYTLRRYDAALNTLDRYIKKGPIENSEVFYKKAYIHFELDSLDLAEKHINLALESDSLVNYYYLRSSIRYSQEDMEGSCEDFIYLSTILKEGEDDPSIIEQVQLSLKAFCDPEAAGYYYQRGVANYNLKNFRKALSWYRKGEVLFPENPIILSFKGNTYMAIEEYDSAISYYHKALDFQEAFESEAILSAGFRGLAGEDLESVLNSILPSVNASLAECYLFKGNLIECEKYLDLAMKSIWQLPPPIVAHLHTISGLLSLSKGDLSQAEYQLNKATIHFPEHAMAYYYLAVTKCIQAGTVSGKGFSMRFRNKGMNLRIPNISERGSSGQEFILRQAMINVDKAILYAPNDALGYALRAVIKRDLKQEGYCYDMLKSRELGFEWSSEEISACLN